MYLTITEKETMSLKDNKGGRWEGLEKGNGGRNVIITVSNVILKKFSHRENVKEEKGYIFHSTVD